ncbi:MAG: type II toxin-antitoxin system RelE/ParE family toxin [Pseudomonadota bacterium]|nr:type II toxin-antitoxin system RelE/ParE family toxin [Pseudomonadota bacterium]
MQLRFSRRANHDLDRLYDFLIENAAALKTADRALLAIKQAALSLLDNPEIGTAINDETGRRELFVPFGKNVYVLRYVPDFDADVVYVLRIWHGREGRNDIPQ